MKFINLLMAFVTNGEDIVLNEKMVCLHNQLTCSWEEDLVCFFWLWFWIELQPTRAVVRHSVTYIDAKIHYSNHLEKRSLYHFPEEGDKMLQLLLLNFLKASVAILLVFLSIH